MAADSRLFQGVLSHLKEIVCYLHVCFNFSVFFFLNITSLNHRLVLVSKWTKITVVLRFFFSKIYLRIFCITNTKTHLPYTDLYSFLKKKKSCYISCQLVCRSRFRFQYVINRIWPPLLDEELYVYILTFIIWKLHMYGYYWFEILSDQLT